MNPIIEPNHIPFSFDTPGWRILFILFALLTLFAVVRFYFQYAKNKYRRDAVAFIQNSEFGSDVEFINDAMLTIKHVALKTYNRKTVASLSGEEWIRFLDSKQKHVDFKNYSPSIFSAVYQGKLHESFDRNAFQEMTICWILKHAG